ncbi:MAG TPA: hypothetical protein VFN46_08710 [Acetobacteraceae bacterium]|nr:hypothetical protein [Acetobacteraceae bacterium]
MTLVTAMEIMTDARKLRTANGDEGQESVRCCLADRGCGATGADAGGAIPAIER